MLTGALNKELYSEWESYIADPAVKQAFRYLVGAVATSANFTGELHRKGYLKDFRIYDNDGQQPHSFVTNKKWLLFYFRQPALRSRQYSREFVGRVFSSVNERKDGELTVKLSSIADVDKLLRLLS